VTTKPVVLILHGPAGSGKDSVIDELRKTTDIHRATSSTSRRPRKGEREGIDYHFLTADQFRAEIADGKFVEHAVVYGEYKGVHTAEVQRHLEAGHDLIIRTDVQGARTWRTKLEGAVYLFLMPGREHPGADSFLRVDGQSRALLGAEIAEARELLKKRLECRESETAESLRLRLAEIDEEIADIPNNDYVVINRQGALNEAVAAVQRIVEAERANPGRKPARLTV
jgi:guanylate kinase